MPLCLFQCSVYRIYSLNSHRLLRRLVSSCSASDLMRRNEIGIQMLSKSLHSRLFPSASTSSSRPKLDLAQIHLKKHGLWNRPTTILPEVDFVDLPAMQGSNIYEHFQNIAYQTHYRYFDLAKHACKFNIPAIPATWNCENFGWTRYLPDGSFERVDHPSEDILIFDVEALVQHSKYPILATAASEKAWYSWLSPVVLESAENERINYNHLIPFGDFNGGERLIIGHSVSYDRARILEEFNVKGTNNRFLDTMSLHVAIAGLSSVQRPIWMRMAKDRKADIPSVYDYTDLEWASLSCTNSLSELCRFYLGKELDKESRNIFIEGNLDDVRENLQLLFNYCANDVSSTHEVYRILFSKFMQRKTCGNMVSFAGILEMGSSILPVTKSWNTYVDTCDEMVDETQKIIGETLVNLAKTCLDSDEHLRETDHYLRQLDWSPATKKNPLPKWYKQLIPSKQKEPKITIKARIAPLLLQLTWMNYPLYYLGSTFGWCYRVPLEKCLETGEHCPRKSVSIEEMRETVRNDEMTKISGATVNKRYLELMEVDMDKARFFKLPSPNRGVKEKNNCGSPFSKIFLNEFISGKMNSKYEISVKAIKDNISCSYWNSSKERIRNQFVVPIANEKPCMNLESSDYGIILPQMNVMGTVTRRAVESTWLTASNAKKDRIGSELKSMVQAPSGYRIVGADVDSQELWIASLMGDAQLGIHGGTAFGWMTLQGTKAEGTDLHSKSAKILGSSRDQAKVFNYARIYGSGLRFSTDLLQKCDSSLTPQQASKRVADLYESTKGMRKSSGGKKIWSGGTESFMFNALERIALSGDPRTPALGCEIPDSLLPKKAREKYITSCVNWVVQSSGVDYLHMLLSSMTFLTKTYDIKARLLITIHDEIRYLVKEEDAERAALALQISNLWTRALFAYQVNIYDLPLSVAFFSSVDVDKVLRKEVFDKCITPSLPNGIETNGKAYSIYDLKNVELGHIKWKAETNVQYKQTFKNSFLNDKKWIYNEI